MATIDDCRTVSEAVRGLCGPLHDVIQDSWDGADRFFVERDMHEDDHRGGRAHLARHLARRQLRTLGAIDGWKMPEKCKPNTEVSLYRGTMKMKVLRPGLLGSVPHPGSNTARVRFYQNPELDLFGAEGSNLIAVWEIDYSGEAVIRIVRTVGTWKALGRERIDIDFLLPRSGSELSGLEFVPSDDEFQFPFDFGDDDDDVEGDDVNPTRG